MTVVFWTSLALVGYSYLLYPLCMAGIARLPRTQPAAQSRTERPRVAVVLAAFNEERHIDARLRNLLALDYPVERLSIYVGSDGSTDRTAALAQGHASSRVHVFAYEARRGKASVLNDLLAAVSEDIVVFTDANTEFSRDAVAALVRHFDDPSVGAVSGELQLKRPAAGDNQDDRYWRLETAIKIGESRIGGLLGANGGIYAIRRELYRRLPADTVVDDFTVAMNVATLGWRTIFEPAARAFEAVPPGIDAEFHRRIRIGIGNYQAFFRYPEYWRAASGIRRFTYLSHKVLRWFTPHLLVLALVASFLCADRAPYGALYDVQVSAYAMLTAGTILRRHVRLPAVLSAPLFVFALNAAFLVGFWRYLTGNFSGQWRRTERA